MTDVRDGRWRYIRYADGSEELYDHDKDTYEWTNLSSHPERAAIKKRLAAHLPKVNVEAGKHPKKKKRSN